MAARSPTQASRSATRCSARISQRELHARAIVIEHEEIFLRQLTAVRMIVASGVEMTVVPLLSKGRRVRIMDGPLHGLEGVVDDASRPNAILISVDVLRQGL